MQRSDTDPRLPMSSAMDSVPPTGSEPSSSFAASTLALSQGPSHQPIGLSQHEITLLSHLREVRSDSHHEAALLVALSERTGESADQPCKGVDASKRVTLAHCLRRWTLYWMRCMSARLEATQLAYDSELQTCAAELEASQQTRAELTGATLRAQSLLQQRVAEAQHMETMLSELAADLQEEIGQRASLHEAHEAMTGENGRLRAALAAAEGRAESLEADLRAAHTELAGEREEKAAAAKAAEAEAAKKVEVTSQRVHDECMRAERAESLLSSAKEEAAELTLQLREAILARLQASAPRGIPAGGARSFR